MSYLYVTGVVIVVEYVIYVVYLVYAVAPELR